MYAATARPNNTAANTVILKEALSEIFSYYDQMCYPTTRKETVEEMTVYSPVQPSDMAKVQKSCIDFLSLTVFECLIWIFIHISLQ